MTVPTATAPAEPPLVAAKPLPTPAPKAETGSRAEAKNLPQPAAAAFREPAPGAGPGRSVLVAGDSLSIFLAEALRPLLAGRPGTVFTARGKVSSGLARPDFFDWEETMRQLAGSTRPDAVVIMLADLPRTAHIFRSVANRALPPDLVPDPYLGFDCGTGSGILLTAAWLQAKRNGCADIRLVGVECDAGMVDETPEDKINEEFWQAAWENPAVAHSITGNAASVSAATPKSLLSWRREHYQPSALTIVAAGAISHETLAGMDVVEMVLVGKVNKNIVNLLNLNGGTAVGLSGKDGRLITARKLEMVIEKGDAPPEIIDLGKVGEVTGINTALITTLLGQGFIPVIAPVGVDEAGATYNINADSVAGAVAAAMRTNISPTCAGVLPSP